MNLNSDVLPASILSVTSQNKGMQTLFFFSKFAYCLWNPFLTKAFAVKRVQMKSQYWCCYVILYPLGYGAGFAQCLGLLFVFEALELCILPEHLLWYDPWKWFFFFILQIRQGVIIQNFLWLNSKVFFPLPSEAKLSHWKFALFNLILLYSTILTHYSSIEL